MKNLYVLRILVILLLIVPCVAQANQLQIIDNTVVAETDRYIIHFEHGSVTYLYNKLTSETYTSLTNPIDSTAVLAWAGEIGYGDESILWVNTDSMQITRDDLRNVSLRYTDEQTLFFIYLSIDPVSGDLLIRQEAHSEKKSLASVSFELANLDSHQLRVILPSEDGTEINSTTPYMARNFPYPSPYWEAQLAIVESNLGGFSVRSTDTAFRYKAVSFSREDDRFALNFSTENDAPFDDLVSIASVEWRLNTYQGDWQVPAGVYRSYMQNAFQLSEFLTHRPAWVDAIKCVAHVRPDNIELPHLLKAYGLVPEETLLISVPPVDASHVLDEVKQLGFKVLISTNARAVFPEEAIYEEYEKYWLKNAWSGEGYTYGTPGSTANHDAWHIYVNPASVAWRNHFISRMKNLYTQVQFDGLFLDVSHLVPNDAGGDAYAVRSSQGAILLRKTLMDIFPGVVFMGEWKHEGFLNQGSFALEHYTPLQAHPISHFLFHPYIKSVSDYIQPDRDPVEIYAALPGVGIRKQLPSLYVWHTHHLDMTDTNHAEDRASLEVRKLINAVLHWQPTHALPWTDFFAEPAVLYDLNSDGHVNILDLVMVANGMGYADPDLNCDGVVNILDLVIVASGF